MVESLKRVLIKHPKDAYINQTKINEQTRQLNYIGVPDYNKAIIDYERFVDFLESSSIQIDYLPKDNITSLDSIYTHDPCVVTNGGIILCNMGKNLRIPESTPIAAFFQSIGVPILGRIEAPGTLEGGDVVWINERTVAVGEGYRTNAEGIHQFKTLLKNHVEKVISVPLPHWTGERDCLHLMSNVSPIDNNL